MLVCYCGLIRLQLSVYKGAGGIQALMKSNARKLAEQDELMLIASGIPYTIIRAGLLESTPGGGQGFSFEEVLLFFFYNGQDQIKSTVLSFTVLKPQDVWKGNNMTESCFCMIVNNTLLYVFQSPYKPNISHHAVNF